MELALLANPLSSLVIDLLVAYMLSLSSWSVVVVRVRMFLVWGVWILRMVRISIIGEWPPLT
jgi:hypothetical protein